MTNNSITENGVLSDSDTRHRIWAIVGASSKSPVEWFDFCIYLLYSLYSAHIFLPSGSTTTQLLQATDVFVTNFLMRPIGGWLFDRIADKHGRKKSMLLLVCIMCMESLVIACLPEYETIDTWASTPLLLVRLFQGLSVGGEHGTGAIYMNEVAVEGKKGFYASFQYMTLIGGQLLALLVVVILQYTLEDSALREWGWCTPFVLSVVLAIAALQLRRQLDETLKQDVYALKEAGSLKSLQRNHRASVVMLGSTAAGSLCFYTFITYMQKCLVNVTGIHANVASGIMTATLYVFMLVQPLFGALSDRIGRRTLMLYSGVLAVVFIVPILIVLQNVISPYTVFALMMCTLSVVSFYIPISDVLKAKIFLAQVHALGVGLSYVVANALFGSSAEYVALSLRSVGMETKSFWYIIALAVVVFLVSLILHGRGKNPRLQ